MNEVENIVGKKKSKGLVIGIAIAIAVVAFAVLGTAIYFVADANSPEKKIAKQLDLGNKYLEDEDYERAIAAFDKAIDIDPKCVDAYLGKAEAYVALDDYEEAIAVLVDGYGETEDKAIKKQLKKYVEEYVDGFVEDGEIDEAIDFMEDIQDEIDDDLFEDYISELTEDNEEVVDEEVPVEEVVEEVVYEENKITLNAVVANLVSEEYAWDNFYSEYPEAMWSGGLETFAAYGENFEVVQDPTFICCGRDILDAIGMEWYDGGVDMDITFTYSYAEEINNYYGDKTIIYYDAVITDLTISYWENVGGDTWETYVLEERSEVVIKDGEIVGWNPFNDH